MAPKKETVLKLTSFRYKKEGISDEEFHQYASVHHAPKAAIVQARHGALKVAQVSTLLFLVFFSSSKQNSTLSIGRGPNFNAI